MGFEFSLFKKKDKRQNNSPADTNIDNKVGLADPRKALGEIRILSFEQFLDEHPDWREYFGKLGTEPVEQQPKPTGVQTTIKVVPEGEYKSSLVQNPPKKTQAQVNEQPARTKQQPRHKVPDGYLSVNSLIASYGVNNQGNSGNTSQDITKILRTKYYTQLSLRNIGTDQNSHYVIPRDRRDVLDGIFMSDVNIRTLLGK